MTGFTIATKVMIEQMFDEAADLYDCTGPSIFSRFGERLAQSVPLAPSKRVLDVATGTGAVLLPIARRLGPESLVTGIDLSGKIIKKAEHAAHAAGLTNVELLKMDAESLDYPDNFFDIVTCGFSLFLFPKMESVLREIHRVLKPDGCIGVSIFDKTPAPFDPGWPILFDQIVSSQTGVIMPQPITYAPDEMEALLNRFGFHSAEAHSEMNNIIYKSLEDWWGFQLTLGPRLTILGMDEQARAKFKDDYFSKLRPLLRQDGLHLAVAVVYATAKR